MARALSSWGGPGLFIAKINNYILKNTLGMDCSPLFTILMLSEFFYGRMAFIKIFSWILI